MSRAAEGAFKMVQICVGDKFLQVASSQVAHRQ